MPKHLVMIADANAHIRCFLKRELAAEGFDVLSAKMHAEVLRRLDTVPSPDLVILDPDLPFIGGDGTLAQIRSKKPLLPVIVYTAYAEDAENPLFAAADAVVEKIPNPALLIQTVQRLLSRPGLMQRPPGMRLHTHPASGEDSE